MKNRRLLPSIVLIVVAIVFSALGRSALAEEAEKPKMTKEEMKKALKDSEARGMQLFADTTLGTSGMSCNSCHLEMGKSKKEGVMGAKRFVRRKPFPKVFPMAERVMTLTQAIQFCIVNPLKGKPLAWNDQRLADMAAYLSTLYARKR